MANIIKHSPRFGDIAHFDPFFDMEDWFKDLGLCPLLNKIEAAPLIKADLIENDMAYTIYAEIPGVKKEDIKVRVDGHRVSISTKTKKEKEEEAGEKIICRECYQGSSYRSFTLGSTIDETEIAAKYENGKLKLTLPKLNGQASE